MPGMQETWGATIFKTTADETQTLVTKIRWAEPLEAGWPSGTTPSEAGWA